jgi:hypothetical protein
VSYSSAELEHRLALSNAIAANLKTIADDGTDLVSLGHRLEGIVAAMRLTREFSDSLNLEQLELRIASISTALRVIKADEVTQELEAKS